MNKAHGKTLIIENNTNNTMINSMINANTNVTGGNISSNGGYTSGNEDDGELIVDQQNLDETYFASKIVDRVACDICNKQVCNKYFLRTHKQKVHGIYDNSPTNGLSENGKNKANNMLTPTNQNHTYNEEDEEEIIEDELQYDDDEDNGNRYNMMIDENEDENEELEYRNNHSNNRKHVENGYNESGKELGELVLAEETGETFQEDHVNKKQTISEKNRRMSTCSNATTSSKF